jgi:hypothetical protein
MIMVFRAYARLRSSGRAASADPESVGVMGLVSGWEHARCTVRSVGGAGVRGGDTAPLRTAELLVLSRGYGSACRCRSGRDFDDNAAGIEVAAPGS